MAEATTVSIGTAIMLIGFGYALGVISMLIGQMKKHGG